MLTFNIFKHFGLHALASGGRDSPSMSKFLSHPEMTTNVYNRFFSVHSEKVIHYHDIPALVRPDELRYSIYTTERPLGAPMSVANRKQYLVIGDPRPAFPGMLWVTPPSHVLSPC